MEQDENIVETVRVVAPIVDGNPHGYVVINRADLSAEHRLFGDAEKAEAPRRDRPPKVREAH